MPDIFPHNGDEALARPQVTDRLFFRSAPDQTVGEQVFGWASPVWPPPMKLVIIREKASSAIKVIDPRDQPEGTVEHFTKDDNYEVFTFKLNRASELPAPAKKREKWFRGAEYVVVSGG